MSKSLLKFISTNSYLVPTCLAGLTLGMLILTLIPLDFLGQNPIWSYDKLGHFSLFAGWTFLFGLYLYIKNSYELHLFSIFATGVFFGILIEILQYFLPLNRHADLFDIAFDSIGCLIGVLALKYLLPDQD